MTHSITAAKLGAFGLCLMFGNLACSSEQAEPKQSPQVAQGLSDFDGSFFSCGQLQTGHCPTQFNDFSVKAGTAQVYLTWMLKHSSKERILQNTKCVIYSYSSDKNLEFSCKLEDFRLGIIDNSPKFYTSPLGLPSAMDPGKYKITANFLIESQPIVDAVIDFTVEK